MIDKKVLVEVYNLLPLTDCGQCGLKTCREFAEKLLLGEKKVDECIPITEENVEKILLILEDYSK